MGSIESWFYFSKYRLWDRHPWPNEVVPTDHWYDLIEVEIIANWYSHLSYGIYYYFFSKWQDEYIISYFTLATLSKDGYLIPRVNQNQSLAYRELGYFFSANILTNKYLSIGYMKK